MSDLILEPRSGRTLVRRALAAGVPRRRLILAGLALAMGLSLWLVALSGWSMLHQLFHAHTEWMAGDPVVLTPGVGLRDAVLPGRSGFSERDLERLAARPEVGDWAPVSSNRFEVVVRPGQVPGLEGAFESLAFLEAMPARFLEVSEEAWTWSPESGFVPILFPAEFLGLYNHAFAPGLGLPRLSPALLRRIDLQMELRGPLGHSLHRARVVGLTHGLPSLLVPSGFLDWANETLAGRSGLDGAPHRVVVQTTGRDTDRFVEWVRLQGWEIAAGGDQASRLQRLGGIFMGALVAVAILILIPAVMVGVLSLLLAIEKEGEVLRRLFLIGLSSRSIIDFFNRRLLVTGLAALLGSGLVLLAAHRWMARELSYLGGDVSASPAIWIPLSALVLAAVAAWTTRSMVAAAVRAQLPGAKAGKRQRS